jgi:signal transduction histidine kinase
MGSLIHYPRVSACNEETEPDRIARLHEAFGIMCSIARLIWRKEPGWITEPGGADTVLWDGAVISLRDTRGQLEICWKDAGHRERYGVLAELAWAAMLEPYGRVHHELVESVDKNEASVLRDAVNEAAEQALRASQVIHHLSDFVARGESRREVHNVRHLVEEASALALVGLRAKGVRVDYDFPPETLLVAVDWFQLQQVLLNLIRNAIEAMQEVEERDLLLKCEMLVDDRMIDIMVADTGPGIKPEILSSLFRPFNTSKPAGMGVGLSICRAIVESHGGKIWVDSTVGKGTTFHLTMRPADEGEAAQVG